MTTKILQIIPTPPNLTDGIGDYALLLAKQLLKEHEITTHFLVFRTDLKVDPVIDEFPITSLPTHNIQALLSVLPEDIGAIVLHYSNYPYVNTNLKGVLNAPFWFPEALHTVINSKHLKLIVMFHELPNLQWKGVYVNALNPVQSIVSRRLVRIASAIITNNTGHQAILARWSGKPVTQVSVFSNVGEPEQIPPLTERKRRMIIFGGSARYRVYRNALKALARSCQTLGIEEIYDIGPSLKLKNLYHFKEINYVEVGFKPKEEISQLMLTSIAGCLDYTPFPGELGKSGVFAAYCSHGLIPITTQYNPSEADGLHMNQHYLVLQRSKKSSWLKEVAGGSSSEPLSLDRMQTIADNARHWYQSHRLEEVTKVFAAHINVSQA